MPLSNLAASYIGGLHFAVSAVSKGHLPRKFIMSQISYIPQVDAYQTPEYAETPAQWNNVSASHRGPISTSLNAMLIFACVMSVFGGLSNGFGVLGSLALLVSGESEAGHPAITLIMQLVFFVLSAGVLLTFLPARKNVPGYIPAASAVAGIMMVMMILRAIWFLLTAYLGWETVTAELKNADVQVAQTAQTFLMVGLFLGFLFQMALAAFYGFIWHRLDAMNPSKPS